jgi:hypothetical protein
MDLNQNPEDWPTEQDHSPFSILNSPLLSRERLFSLPNNGELRMENGEWKRAARSECHNPGSANLICKTRLGKTKRLTRHFSLA